MAAAPARDGHAVYHVEMVLVWAVLAMLVSRAVLGNWVHAWPHLGDPDPGQLLCGALLMLVALLMTLSFIGSTIKTTAAVVGGLGCGLLIGAADDFIAANNDVFWRLVVTIMYAAFTATAIGMRCLHDRHAPTSRQDLARAAAIAVRGVADGLDSARRVRALRLLERAANQGGDSAAVVDLSRLISRCPEAAPATTPFAWLRKLVAVALAWEVPRARWVSWMACLVLLAQAVIASTAVVVSSRLVAISLASAVWQIFTGMSVVALSVAALLRLRRHRLQALRLGRYAALITVLTTALFDFSAEGFVVFGDIAIDLLVLAVLIQQLRMLAPDPLG